MMHLQETLLAGEMVALRQETTSPTKDQATGARRPKAPATTVAKQEAGMIIRLTKGEAIKLMTIRLRQSEVTITHRQSRAMINLGQDGATTISLYTRGRATMTTATNNRLEAGHQALIVNSQGHHSHHHPHAEEEAEDPTSIEEDQDEATGTAPVRT
jgi:hypothetical protein